MYVKYLLQPPGQLFYRKKLAHDGLGRDRVVLASAEPVEFEALESSDLLDTSDLLRLIGCSPATLYRYIWKREITPSLRVGREMFFSKSAVSKWRGTRGPKGRKSR